MNLQPILSRGWVFGDPFPQQSLIITVQSGDGVNATAPRQILSKEIPPSARLYIERLSIRVVDQAGYDQLYFALRRNGSVIVPWHKISGEQLVDDHAVSVDQEFEAGTIEIVGTNISGTGESGATTDTLDVRVIARMYGYLLRYTG